MNDEFNLMSHVVQVNLAVGNGDNGDGDGLAVVVIQRCGKLLPFSEPLNLCVSE